MSFTGKTLLVAMLALALASCGARTVHPVVPAVQAGAAEGEAREDITVGGDPGDRAPAPAEPDPGYAVTGPGDGATGQPTQAAVERTPPPRNNGVVTISLSSDCVRVGDVLVVTIAGPAKGGLGAIIGFSDNQSHGAMITGETDAGGQFVWRVPIEPTVPPGTATVLVTVSGPNWSQEGGGRADKTFTVGGLSGC